ncbi:MAG: hypothetical protein ACTHM6_13005 [Tepidisphaeraceae bacterium]
MLEPLETRRHFAVSLDGNILTITGTTHSDAIAIAAGKRTFHVFVNGKQNDVPTRSVRTVRIYGGLGDDKILVSPNFQTRCSIQAGSGSDLVAGGGGSDSIWGQDGNDTLIGNQGGDYMDGGAGDDALDDYRTLYSSKVNVLHGGAGNDRAACSAADYATGIESLQAPGKSVLDVRNGKILLTLTVDNGNDGGFTIDGIEQRSPGVFVVHETHTRSNWSFGSAPITATLDITTAKGSKVLIERQHYFVDSGYELRDEGTESFMLADRL